jgi:hypothetical protein
MRCSASRLARPSLLILLSTAVAGCSREGPAPEPPPDKALRCFIERTPCAPPEDWLKEGDTARSWRNELVFPKLGARIAIDRTSIINWSDGGREWAEFSRKTLKVRWLDNGRLLWATWQTFPQGSGGHCEQGTLVVELSETNAHELYRGVHAAHGRSGWSSWRSADLHVSLNRAHDELIFTTTTTTFDADETHGGPLYAKELLTGHRASCFVRRLVSRQVRAYRIENHELRFKGGYEALDLGDRAFPVADVAEHCGTPTERLRQLNARLARATLCTGQIVVDDRIAPLRLSANETGGRSRSRRTHNLINDGTFCRYVPRDAIPPAASAVRPRRSYRVVHVFVSLCDNEHQGIARVPSALGNGQDPKTNLYWGARYGVKTFFERSARWRSVKLSGSAGVHSDAAGRAVRESCVFQSVNLDPPVYVVADAWDGRYAAACVTAFYGAAAGVVTGTADIDEDGRYAKLRTGADADLVCFVGHNAFLDGEIGGFPKQALNPVPAGAFVLSCLSENSFAGRLKFYGCEPLLVTAGTMAPEAYALDAAVRAWAAGATTTELRRTAAAAYATYQGCALDTAERLFVAGSR